ncbi:hypothetical protein P154DRAFT_581597 [Amniculicola lignicola CBS 123094]|uniref:GPI anchored protein n=1 Tax=Amniculicola lignicola CBS 123094 TaxID=1392246 RepID=A0A6A5W0Y1_9PLEO|nr:hypothetical protein P154DRAFT_581597 [Amniculicola lignicola CBS 123094]
MRPSTPTLLALLPTLALAQNQTISFFFPLGADPQSLVGSVVSANPSTTTLSITCPTDDPAFDSNNCGFGPGLSYSIISQTEHKGAMSDSGFTMTYACTQNAGMSEMSCGISMGGSEANDPGTTDLVLSGTDYSAAWLPATLTAGVAKLSASASVAPESTGGGELVESLSVTPVASTGSGVAATTGSGAAASSTGAAYKIGVEGGVLLALVGGAAWNVL